MSENLAAIREEIDDVLVHPDVVNQLVDAAREGYVKIEIDPSFRKVEPASEGERAAWAAYDTAYNVLRRASVQLALFALAESNPGMFRSMDEALAETGVNVLDLAPVDHVVETALKDVLGTLVMKAMVDALAALEGSGFTVIPVDGGDR